VSAFNGSADNPQPGESWYAYWKRRHEARADHGPECNCTHSQVNEKRRFAPRYGEN
jgi:hypothetical protein